MSNVRSIALLLAGSLLLVIAGVGVGLFLRHAAPGIDRSIVETLARHRSAETVVWMKRVSIFGSTVILLPLVALVAVGLIMRHQSSDAMLLLAVSLGTLAVHNAVKALADRPRPPFAAFHVVGAGFPSGHTAQAVAVYGALAYLLQRRTDHASLRRVIFAAAALLAGAIGFSRIWLGVHYPSDVLGGAALAGAELFFAVMLFRRRDPAWTRASSES